MHAEKHNGVDDMLQKRFFLNNNKIREKGLHMGNMGVRALKEGSAGGRRVYKMEWEYTRGGWEDTAVSHLRVYVSLGLTPPTSVYDTPPMCISFSYAIPLRYLTSAYTFNSGCIFPTYHPTALL